VASEASAPLAAAGSVASATTSSSGLSPRSTRVPKSLGMTTTNATSPDATSSSAAAIVFGRSTKR
jgi:hypothetical protein